MMVPRKRLRPCGVFLAIEFHSRTSHASHMTLRSRLGAGLVTIAIILVLPLVFAIRSLNRLHEDAKALRDREFSGLLLIGRVREGLNNLRREELALLFSYNSAARDTVDHELSHLGAMADTLSRFQLPSYAQDIRSAVQQIQQAAPSEYAAALAGDTAKADALSAKVFVPALNRADSTATFAESAIRDRTSSVVSAQTTAIGRTTTVSVTALALALFIAAVIAILLTRSISEPVLDLRAGMTAVADGDLDFKLRIPSDRTDEFGTL